MIEVDRKLTMAPLVAAIQSISFNHKPSFLLIILTHPVNFSSERKPENPEKTHDYQQSWRTLPTCNQIFEACSYMFVAGFEPLTSETISCSHRSYFSSSEHSLQPQLEWYYNLGCVEWSNYTKSLLFSDTWRVINKLIQLERYSGGYWFCKFI